MNILDDENDTHKKDNHLCSDEKVSLWSRIFKNEDNPSYSEIIIKGFVWVIMFVISLGALYLFLKDGYGTNKEVIVLNNKNNHYIDNITTPNNNFEYNTKNNNNALLNKHNIKENNTKIQKVPSNPNEVVLKDNKKDNKSSQQLASNNIKDPIFQNNLSSEDTNIDSLIIDSVNKNDNENNSVVNKDTAINKTDTVTKTTTDANKVWLVTVYSGRSESKARSNWKVIQQSNPKLFINKNPYFIKTDIENKGVFYRVSLGDTKANSALSYFITSKEATSYCNYLKNNNVNCFITVANKNLLKTLINKE